MEASSVEMTCVRCRGAVVHGKDSHLHMVRSNVMGNNVQSMQGFCCTGGGTAQLHNCSATTCDCGMHIEDASSEMSLSDCESVDCSIGMGVYNKGAVSANACSFFRSAGIGVNCRYATKAMCVRCFCCASMTGFSFDDCDVVSLKSCTAEECKTGCSASRCADVNVNGFTAHGKSSFGVVIANKSKARIQSVSVASAKFGLVVQRGGEATVARCSMHRCTCASVVVETCGQAQMEDVVCTGADDNASWQSEMDDMTCSEAEDDAGGFECCHTGTHLHLRNCSSESSSPFVEHDGGKITWYGAEDSMPGFLQNDEQSGSMA